ncbi:RNA binding motif protein 12Ba [Lates calcarifer]|uniref:RNA binding motif protein 12Ba n=1 Tax=Lates calcarifer TaxID=8187 RepID=A0A4W6CCT1_LATCA|nr:RNA binding motif protein 12Ba [Lates calcarifer]
MPIILRLEGLDVKAGTEDIRKFFECLHIPDGGVYIVGGSLREAFIAFTTERDAQLAMRYTGNFLKRSQVTLHISSMSELEHKLESLIKRKKHYPSKLTVKSPPTSPNANLPSVNALPRDHNNANPPPSTSQPLDHTTANVPHPLHSSIANLQTSAVSSLDSSAAFLLGVCTVLQGLQSSHQREYKESVPRVGSPKADSTVVASDVVRTPELTLNSRPGYVRVFGLPASATKDDICHFFSGLAVEEAIVNVKLGLGMHVCLVKFANTKDACDALHFNQRQLGSFCVEVRGASEKMWTSALQDCENALDDEEIMRPNQNPLREAADHQQKSVYALQMKRQSVKQLQHKSPKKPRPDRDSQTTLSPGTEYIVMVSNLLKKMTKTEIKELFGCPNIAHKNVLHLLDKEGNRTDTAFLIFNCTEDYDYAMNLTGCHVGSNAIKVSSVTREKMRDMMAKTHPRNVEHCLKMDTMKKGPGPVGTPKDTFSMNPDQAAQTCLFVRNLPADVQKSQIKTLFSKYKLRKDNITLLHDSDGKGIGEAVVQFKSQKLAALAHGLHGQDFLGTQVLLTCISVKQMQDIFGRHF